MTGLTNLYVQSEGSKEADLGPLDGGKEVSEGAGG